MTWTGVDLGKVYTQICELSDDGQIWELRIPTTRARLLEIFRRRTSGRRSVRKLRRALPSGRVDA